MVLVYFFSSLQFGFVWILYGLCSRGEKCQNKTSPKKHSDFQRQPEMKSEHLKTRSKHVPPLNSEFRMNWQYFLSDCSSQLSTALVKTQRGDQRFVLERAWTHNGPIKSKCLKICQRSKELLQRLFIHQWRYLYLLCYWEQRTKAGTWLFNFHNSTITTSNWDELLSRIKNGPDWNMPTPNSVEAIALQ